MKTIMINRTNYSIIILFYALFSTNIYLRNFSEKKKKNKSMQTRLKLINLDTLAMKYKPVVTILCTHKKMRIYLLKKRKKRVQRGTEKKVHPLICERENG